MAGPTGNPLLVPELLQWILDCFLLTPSLVHNPEKQRTLLALALTCRATSEPCIDRIWRELNSLEPLVWCLKGFETREEWDNSEDDEDDDSEDEDDSESEASGSDRLEYRSLDALEEMIPPTPSEWNIIRRYSHRVRELTISYESFSLRFLRSIGSQPSPLLPNLRRLYWRPYDAQLHGSIALIQPLLTPSLVKLTATFAEDAGSAMLISFLNGYHIQCPNLKTLSFGLPKDKLVSPLITGELSSAICRHKNLESVKVSSPINIAALRYLALSSTVNDLSLVYSPELEGPQSSFLEEEIPFCHVKCLQLAISDLNLASSFLRPHHQIFYSFHLDLSLQPPASDISAFFLVLVSRSPKNPLRKLRFNFAEDEHIHFRPPIPEEIQTYGLSYQSFLPLTSLASLHELYINWQFQISLDDNELTAMARSWPSLRKLRLECCRGVHATLLTKYPTLNGLLALITFCPNLQLLSIPVNATEVPIEDATNITNTAIHSLDFPESPINHARPVADFLFKHFPAVTHVNTSFSLRVPRYMTLLWGYRELWDEVSNRMRFLGQKGE